MIYNSEYAQDIANGSTCGMKVDNDQDISQCSVPGLSAS